MMYISIYNILNLRPSCGTMSYCHVGWSIILPHQLLLEVVILYFNPLPHQLFYFSFSTSLLLSPISYFYVTTLPPISPFYVTSAHSFLNQFLEPTLFNSDQISVIIESAPNTELTFILASLRRFEFLITLLSLHTPLWVALPLGSKLLRFTNLAS